MKKTITQKHCAWEMPLSKAIVENIIRSRRDNSEDKITDCTSRAPRFDYLNRHGSLQHYLSAECLKSSSGVHMMRIIQVGKTPIHIK